MNGIDLANASDQDRWFALPKEQRDALVSWLREHDLRMCQQWQIDGDVIRAYVFRVNAKGQRFFAHPDGSEHHRETCTWPDGHPAHQVAAETRVVPLLRPPPEVPW